MKQSSFSFKDVNFCVWRAQWLIAPGLTVREYCDMRIGVSPFAASREVALELASSAVQAGLDTIWLGDGYLSNPDFAGFAGGMETMTELAWLAGHLPEARVGITAAVLPMRDMAWLAKQANTLHRLAGGGFVLVATAGFWAHDLAARGIAFESRGTQYRASVDELRAALLNAELAPGPDPDGPPPLWLAGATATRRLAVKLGLPFQSSRATPPELAPIAQRFFADGGTVLAHRVRVQAGEHQVASDQVDWHAVTGSVGEIVDAFGQFRELGVVDLSVVPGSDDETSRHTIAVLGDVLPQLTSS